MRDVDYPVETNSIILTVKGGKIGMSTIPIHYPAMIGEMVNMVQKNKTITDWVIFKPTIRGEYAKIKVWMTKEEHELRMKPGYLPSKEDLELVKKLVKISEKKREIS